MRSLEGWEMAQRDARDGTERRRCEVCGRYGPVQDVEIEGLEEPLSVCVGRCDGGPFPSALAGGKR